MDEGRKSGSRERRGWEENWPSGVRPPDHRARGGANPRYIPRGRVFASVRRRPWVEIHPSQHPRHHALHILTHGGETGRGGSLEEKIDAIYGTDDRAGERAEQLGREGNQDTTHKMSLTKNPTNPMTMNPRPVRSATLLNSLRSGLVHLFRSRMESLAKSRTGLTAMSATSMLFCYHSCVFDSGRGDLECGDRRCPSRRFV